MAYINGKRVLYATVRTKGTSGKAVEISSAEEMNTILSNATADDYGKIYLYTGESTSDYEQNTYYILGE